MGIENQRGRRKTREGVALRDASRKTVVVVVERRARHPQYGKEMRFTKKYYAHDEENKARAGDKVRIVETRPVSRLKRWRLVNITGHGALVSEGGAA